MNENFVNLRAEQSVLGCFLAKPDLLLDCKLNPIDFDIENHQTIFGSLLEMNEANEPIDITTVANRLGNKLYDVGGITYLAQLQSSIPTVGNFKQYEGIVSELSLRRRTMDLLAEKMSDGKSIESAEQFIADIQDGVTNLAEESNGGKSFRPMSEVLEDHEDLIVARQSMKGLTGVKTASSVMDKLTGGHQNQDLILIAARPSVGKTAFMLNDARAAAQSDTVDAVGIISLEMPDMPIAERIISSVGNIDSMKIRTGRLDDEDWSKYTMSRQIVKDMPLYIDDSPGATIREIATKVRNFKRTFGRVIIYIDYLQLISGGKKFANSREETEYVSGQLKRIARENDCPIVVISSLSRAVEQRQDKRPMMSDLRESGKLEFDADSIIFLYRDDYYNHDSEHKNIVEVNIAKGRNTGTGMFEMVYLKHINKFLDLDYRAS
ncbi:replicative DNA helicase [Paenibacillus sp. ACRRX]|uniref:replicative DNA helicase n=1 Tax=Paenibacillus sp. ACRRX TaxID=2918206 RepID=UPI001EF5FB49|nr:replicative DNA helicase [Paenibacillus sp. ACRRX]MCG7410592.1 replicative DNA helicase [Paenibacillus sp. ACRRX]